METALLFKVILTVLLTFGAAAVVGVPHGKRTKMNTQQIVAVLAVVVIGGGVLVNLLQGIV